MTQAFEEGDGGVEVVAPVDSRTLADWSLSVAERRRSATLGHPSECRAKPTRYRRSTTPTARVVHRQYHWIPVAFRQVGEDYVEQPINQGVG